MSQTTLFHSAVVDGVDVFYREAGHRDQPTVLLLHGFPSSSHMFRNLIPALANDYHIIAPDYPGFGHSGMPKRDEYSYTFDSYADTIGKLLEQLQVDRYAIYVFDYGAPVGFRLFTQHPERVTAIVSQNGNAYDEGLGEFWAPLKAYWNTHAEPEREALRFLVSPEATRWQYETGVPAERRSRVSPDAWQHDQSLLDRPGNAEIQLDLAYQYRTNPPLYPMWQAALREHQPPLLAVWGKNDEIFIAPGAEAFKRDLPKAEVHLVDAGHFALESHGPEIADLMLDFLGRVIPLAQRSA